VTGRGSNRHGRTDIQPLLEYASSIPPAHLYRKITVGSGLQIHHEQGAVQARPLSFRVSAFNILQSFPHPDAIHKGIPHDAKLATRCLAKSTGQVLDVDFPNPVA
jgi:hypothetical protein